MNDVHPGTRDRLDSVAGDLACLLDTLRTLTHSELQKVLTRLYSDERRRLKVQSKRLFEAMTH